MTIDFHEFPPNEELMVSIAGPGSPYAGTLKTDGTGRAQLIWRSGRSGDHTVTARSGKVSESADFTLHAQPGTEDTAEAKTVEDVGSPGKADEHDPELDATQDDPAFKPAGSKTTSKAKSTTRKGK